MKEINKKLNALFVGVVVVVALVAVLVGASFSKTAEVQNGLGAIGTKNIEDYVPVVKYNEGLYTSLPIQTASTVTAAGVTNSSTLTQTGAATFAGLLTADAGTLRSYKNATSTTATTQTLAQADILNYDTILLTPNTGALTATLPATSTLTSLVPTAGDLQETCIYNATSTAAATITLAAGAGMDLERVATSTTSGSTGVLAIPAQGSACLKFVRQTDTDISVLMTSFINAD